MSSLVEGEHDENEIRKDFTVSERVAIGKAIEEEIGKRQGQRTDKPKEEPSLSLFAEEKPKGLRQNFAEVVKGARTDAMAAEKAGFGNRETYRQAKAVVEKAEPEIVKAVDDGRVSVSAAPLPLP